MKLVKMKMLVALLSPTLCDPVDCSPPGSCVHGILQGICPFPRNLPDPGIEPGSPILQANSFTSEPPGKPEHRPKMIPNVNRGKDYTYEVLFKISSLKHLYEFYNQNLSFGELRWVAQG